MKSIGNYKTIVLLTTGLLLSGLWQYACKSDNQNLKTATQDAASQNQQDQDAGDATQAPAPLTLGEMAAQLEGYAKEHEAFRQKFMSLRDQYNAIPAEVKQNAANCAELEGRLDGFLEKGGIRTDELDQAVATLRNQENSKAKPTASAETAAGGAVPFEALVEEQKRSVQELNTQVAEITKAIDQLKASIPKKGKGVVLFQ